MSKLTVDGVQYRVTESMGFNHSAGGYAKAVVGPDGVEKIAFKYSGGTWFIWGVQDRAGPMRHFATKEPSI